MTRESLGSHEFDENETLQSIVASGKGAAAKLQERFGEVFYPMKHIRLVDCTIAYSNPGGDHPISLRMHQLVSGHTSGIEVSLFFRAMPGSDGKKLLLFQDDKNKSSISESLEGTHAYHFIDQDIDGSLITNTAIGEALAEERLVQHADFVREQTALLAEELRLIP